jgi:phosphonate transport system substrate-binding protein
VSPRRRRLAAALALAPLAGALRAAPREKPLVLALIAPSQPPEQVRAAWQPLAERLSRRLQAPVTLQVSKHYAEVLAALLEGRADLAWLSNASALEAVEADKAEVFATMQTVGPDGEVLTGYRSMIVVRADAPLKSLDDLVARAPQLAFRMGDEKSTSGYSIPRYYAFARRGLDPARLFRSLRTGSHAENMAAVLQGEADACTTNDEELKKLAQRDAAAAARLRPVWTSQEIRQSPLLWSTALPREARAAIREVVLRFGASAEEQQALMEMNRIRRFVPSSNRQLLPIADIELFTARSAVAADAGLSAPQRAEAERRIHQRATRLELLLKRS